MILITGSVVVRPEHLAEAERLCVEHSVRSRSEPGCLHHAAHRDLEDARRIVFVERWADRAAVDAHFAVPASLAFVQAIGGLAAESPSMQVMDVIEQPATDG